MNTWKQFLDTLDTPGGHIAVAFVLFLGGAFMVYINLGNGKEVSELSLGALLLALKGSRPNGAKPE